MKALTCTDGNFELVTRRRPTPAAGQLLLDVLRCGICGSDLHARHHADELHETTAAVGYDGIFRSNESVVFGHEFVGEVAGHAGRTARGLRPGTRVVAFPLLRKGKAVHTTGLSPDAPGGFAEQVLAEQSLSFAVPNGLRTDVAALTEPMAVALHAVRRSDIQRHQVAVVVGCGPVGLAVIGILKAIGVRTVIASDLSAGRRKLATACGADVVVDAAAGSPFATASEYGHMTAASDLFELAVSSMRQLRRIPIVPWERVWQAAELVGATKPKHPVVFECVGVPGMINELIATAPLYSRLVVVGVCMAPDTIRPVIAINKEIDLRFVLGYTPREFRDALHLLAEGKVRAEPVVTGIVGLPGVETAFDTLGRAEHHAKVLVDPQSSSAEITTPG